MLLYVLKRVGLALVTLVLLSMIIFFAGQVLPGNAGKGDPRKPSPRNRPLLALDHKLGVDRSLSRPVLELGLRDSCRAISAPPTSSNAPVSSFLFPAPRALS